MMCISKMNDYISRVKKLDLKKFLINLKSKYDLENNIENFINS